ncbi:MAG TPA: TMEM175 family protein [Pseudolysinimonas sp.]|jgi:uncharacterized membrane protein
MGTPRGFDRLVFFTDAVTAIAITLLILPLVDLVPEYATHDGASVGGFIQQYWTQVWSFALSFLIIARLWMANHSSLEHVERQSPTLMWLDVAWAFTVVVLPLPTALIATLPTDRPAFALYIGTMTASSLLLAGMCWEVYRRPELGATDRQQSLVSFYGIASTAGAFVLALILSQLFPAIGLFWLLLLLVTFPLDWIVKPRLHARIRNAADTPHG